MTNRIVFRYHKEYDVCVQNLINLRKLNPTIAIDGLFGGDERAAALIPNDLLDLLNTNWVIPFDDPYYKWKNGDLCTREWYKQFGKNLSFTHITLIEWDLHTFKPLTQIYPPLVTGYNYASIFGDYHYARKINWDWIKETSYEFQQFQSSLQKSDLPFNIETLSFGIMGGAVLCREFLDKYTEIPIPSYCNDELRFSVYSQAFGIPLRDNGLYLNPKNLFDADNKIFGMEDYNIVKENGGDMMHPLRFVIQNDLEQ